MKQLELLFACAECLGTGMLYIGRSRCETWCSCPAGVADEEKTLATDPAWAWSPHRKEREAAYAAKVKR